MKDKRVAEAEKKALEEFDYILEVRTAPSFVEIVASIGGDIVRRRYYDDGTECDK